MFAVRTPDYEVNRAFWFDGHYAGNKLYSDEFMVEITPPKADTGWSVRYRWGSSGQTIQQAVLSSDEQGRAVVSVAFASNQAPGIAGVLRFVISPLS